MLRRLRLRARLTWAAALLWACGSSAPPSLPSRPLVAAVAGCAAWTSQAVCEVEAGRELRLVLDVLPQDAVRIASDRGVTSTLREVQVERGRRFVLRVPVEASRLVVEVRTSTWQGKFEQRVAPRRVPPWFAVAEASRAAGHAEAAEAPARAALARPTERAFALGVLGRIALSRGAFAEAEPLLREASALHAASGRNSDAARDAFALVHSFTESLRFDEAYAMLASVEPLARSAELAMQLELYRAKAAQALGDLAEALRAAERCERAARRLGDQVHEHAALWVRTFAAAQLGAVARVEAGLRELARSAPASFGACDRLSLDVMLAFGQNALAENLADREARQAGARATASALALALSRAEACDDPRLEANGLHELALAQLLSGQIGDAVAALARSRLALGDRPYRELSIEWLYLEGRIALARGASAAALRAFRAMEQAAAGERWLEARVRALAHQAEALGRDRAAALDTYARMEDLLDALVERAPLGIDRADVSSSAERHSAAHAALSIEAGDVDGALATVMRARGRATRLLLRRAQLSVLSAERRQAWLRAVTELRRSHRELEMLDARSRTADVRSGPLLDAERAALEQRQLASLDAAARALGEESPTAADARRPAPGELMLSFFAAGTRWFGLAQSADASRAAQLPAAAPADAASAALWLAPFADLVRASTRVLVSPPAALEALDWHVVPLDGEPLVARRDVAYRLGTARPGRRVADRASSLLVVADPEGDLPGARAEAAWLAPFFARGGRSVRLLTQEQATAAALARELGRHHVFHFAGHTRFDPEQPWLLSLSLHDGGHFRLSDVLGLETAPRLVVLSACEGARGSAGLALGSAFVAAGVGTVVAAARAVDDALSLRFVQHFYAALAREPDPARAARLAQAELLRERPGADAATFRVLVP